MGRKLLLTTAVFFVLFIVTLFVLNSVHPLSQVIETRPAFDVGKAEETLKTLGDPGRESYRWFEVIDFGFMAFYTLMFGFATVTVAHWKEPGTVRWAWLAVAAPAFVLDAAENLTMIFLLGDTAPSRATLNVVWLLGIGKFTFFAAAFVVPALWAVHLLLDKTRTVYENEMRVERTYFSLRLALTGLMAALLVALGFHAILTSCIRQSISAYYYTPLQAMFVGTLIAVGACLIVYQGTTYIENILLDIAGFLAFIVAFVPTTPTDKSCQESIVQSDANPADLVLYNVVPLLGVTITATTWTLWKRYQDRTSPGRKPELNRIRAGLVAQIVILGAVLAIPDGFKNVAHWIAASLLFVCVIAVVWSNHLARSTDSAYRTKSRWARNTYALVIAAMGAVLVATAVMLVVDWAYKVTFVEAGLILAFAVFWGIQTADLKAYANRAEKAAEEREAPGSEVTTEPV